MMRNQNDLFVIADGDNIRYKIESYIFENQLEELTAFSNSLIEAVDGIKEIVVHQMGATLIMAGGDDFCFVWDKNEYDKKQLKQIMEYFQAHTGCTISFGVGENIEAAYLNLMKAKAKGKSQIVFS